MLATFKAWLTRPGDQPGQGPSTRLTGSAERTVNERDLFDLWAEYHHEEVSEPLRRLQDRQERHAARLAEAMRKVQEADGDLVHIKRPLDAYEARLQALEAGEPREAGNRQPGSTEEAVLAHLHNKVDNVRRDMTAAKADSLGLTPMARVIDHVLAGSDPVLMLTGPIDATQQLLELRSWENRRHLFAETDDIA